MITQEKAFKAYAALKKLSDVPMAFSKAKVIFDLKQKLQPCWDFQTQEEQKIFDMYPDLDVQTMTINLEGKDEEARKKALEDSKEIDQKLRELGKMDSGFEETEPVKLVLSDDPRITISAKDIEYLSTFVEIS